MSQSWLGRTFGVSKPIISMIHIRALPGTPDYDADGGIPFLINEARTELIAAQEGGVDGVLFCNEHDRPYVFEAGPEIVAAMTSVVSALRPEISVPFGIDVLWDARAAIAIAHATRAAFVREVITGAYAADFGLWTTDPGKTLRYRRAIGAEAIKLFYNINAEFGASLAERPVGLVAKSVAMSSLATILCVSGAVTGSPPSSEDLMAVKAAAPSVAVIVNTGVTTANAVEKLALADGAIVGTSIKIDGETWNPIDRDRVQSLMKVVRDMRLGAETPGEDLEVARQDGARGDAATSAEPHHAS